MATAAQKLRDRLKPFPVTIDGVEVTLKRPDVRWLIYTRTLPVPLLQKMSSLLTDWIGQDLSKVADKAREGGEDALLVLNTLTCICMVEPHVVMTQEEFDGLPTNVQENTLVVNELEVDFKERVLVQAMMRAAQQKQEAAFEQKSAEEFSEVGRSEGTVEDVPSVRSETVDGAGDHES